MTSGGLSALSSDFLFWQLTNEGLIWATLYSFMFQFWCSQMFQQAGCGSDILSWVTASIMGVRLGQNPQHTSFGSCKVDVGLSLGSQTHPDTSASLKAKRGSQETEDVGHIWAND